MQYLAEENKINTFEAHEIEKQRTSNEGINQVTTNKQEFNKKQHTTLGNSRGMERHEEQIETAFHDKFHTEDDVRRQITYEFKENIATHEEHRFTKDEKYCISTELNNERVKPPQQIDKREKNSRPSAGASRGSIELLYEQINECNAYFRANIKGKNDKKGRDNERMPGDTEKINKSDNNEFADETSDKKEKLSTKKAECIEKKERYDEETTCEDNSSQTDAAIHCIEGNICDNDVRCDATPRAEENATDEYNYGKPRLPSDDEWNKYYENFGKSLNSYEADYDDINDVCEYTDSYEKIKAEQSECEFIGHLDEYGDEHLEDFYGKLNIIYDNERLNQLLETLKINETSDQGIIELIKEFQDVFHIKGENLTTMHNVEHAIYTKDEVPVNAKPYRFPQSLKEELERQLNEMIKSGIIEPSCSSYRSNISLVPKAPDSKGNKKYRLVVDFRQLNEKTEPDRYPLPNILDIIDHVGNAKYFSTLDLSSGFYQCMLKEEHRHKTAFSTAIGLFQFVKMPMGLSNSPATFQRGMDIAFKGQQQKDIFLYLDDAVVFSNTKEEHYVKLYNFLARAREVNLKLQPEKCNFLKTEVVYLGHVLSEEGVRCDPRKLDAVRKFPTPRNVKQVRQFLGLAGYYRRFIRNFANIAKPLTELQKKNRDFAWTETEQEALNTLKDLLCEGPVLQVANPNLDYIVTSDASKLAIGGYLAQLKDKVEMPIGYVSRALSDVEQKYDTYSREALAIVFTITKFKAYLLGRINVVADCLSRNPTTEDINVVTRARTTKTARPNYKVTRKYVKKRKKPEKETITEGQKQNDDIDETTVQSTAEAPEIVPIPQEQEQADEGEETIVQPPEEAPEQPEEYAIDRHRINYEEDFEKCDSEIVIEKMLIECREKLFMRKDNYAFFIDCDGRATDEGASQLLSQNKLKTVKSDPGEVTMIKRKQTVEFAICIKKHNDSTPCIIDNIEKRLLVLKALIEKLGINTISIAKSQEISHVPWVRVENMLKALFVNVEAKIIICNGEMKFVPLQERQQVLRDMHASAIGGHKGISKIVRRMRPLYDWKSMKRDIIKFIQRCDTCQLEKLVRKKVRQPMVISDTPYDAMQKVAIDIVGPLPRTKKGNNNILTIQCNLTKFCRAIALQDATAETVTDAFLKEFICIFSCPQIILSDQGTNFTSKVFVNLAKAFKIKTVTTTAYRPSSNGSLKRSHHSLAEYLKTVAGKNKEWDDILEMAMFSYNTSVHEAHQFQPFQLVFGKLPTLPTEVSIEKSGKIVTYTYYVRKLCKTLSEIKAIAREKLIDAKLKNKFYYDRKTNAESFKPGDYVYLLKGGKQHKLGDQYTGPYLVLEVNNDNNNVKIEIKNCDAVAAS
uniref:RNA-directed DNA polymerase n=1 Tax=Trichogramma kaykai TaxID=54128 RepID=A0ABD2WE69_9HYME